SAKFSGDPATSNPRYGFSAGENSLTVTAGFTLSVQSSLTYGQTGQATTTGVGTGAVTYSTTGGCTVAANGTITVTDASAGTCQVTANKAGDGSFAPSSDTKTITLNKAAVTVTADAKTKVYGTNDPSLTYHITSGSLVGNDTFSGSLTRDPGDTAGTYNITQGSLALSSNYTLAFNGAQLEIAAATLTVKADHTTKAYGTATDPALTYQIG